MTITRRVGGREAVTKLQMLTITAAAKYKASQVAAEINATQKEIGQKKKASKQMGESQSYSTSNWFTKAKENADDLLKKKEDLTNHKKALEDSAIEKEKELYKKLKTIGNYVHESVPISDNEVREMRC